MNVTVVGDTVDDVIGMDEIVYREDIGISETFDDVSLSSETLLNVSVSDVKVSWSNCRYNIQVYINWFEGGSIFGVTVYGFAVCWCLYVCWCFCFCFDVCF